MALRMTGASGFHRHVHAHAHRILADEAHNPTKEPRFKRSSLGEELALDPNSCGQQGFELATFIIGTKSLL